MESLQTFFFGLLFFLGLVFVFFKKSRKLGATLVIVSTFFLFILPAITFKKYKIGTEGVYTNSGRTKIANENGTYKILKDGKVLSRGNIEYINIDNYSFYLDKDQNYVSNEINKIYNTENDTEVFYK